MRGSKLDESGDPVLFPDEKPLTIVNGVDFKYEKSTFKNCRVYLTSTRVIVLGRDCNFAASIEGMEERKFNQPIFGVNNISGKLQEDVFIDFSISFPNGGCASFFTAFTEAEAAIRARRAQPINENERQQQQQQQSLIDSMPTINEAAIQSVTNPLKAFIPETSEKKND
eukprot:m.138502 g.138502  ORF g.138502 m.138502 type:complete len:169 (-) comp15132_c0_seq1:68-574(-)